MVLPLFIAGSSGCYYVQQGRVLLAHQFSAQPISRCLKDSALSEKERSFFNEIAQIRRYAFDSLGLKQNSSYTRYVRVDSSYLVAVLSVADSVSLVPKKWCYPVFGCFPLRAYHDINDAKKVGERFVAQGYEINIDRVDGFSTLGIFSDPLYSFMADYPVFSLARFLFHEQMHATAYFKNVQFSEELATFIGNEAALDYLKVRYGDTSKEYGDAKALLADQKTWVSLLRTLHADLDTLYRSTLARGEKIHRKLEIIKTFRTLLHERYDSLFTTQWYRGAEKVSFNNAYLSVRMTYNLDLELFSTLRQQKKGSLREVVAYVKLLKKQKKDPKKMLVEYIKSGNLEE